MSSKVYLIERVYDSGDCRFYAEHGEKGGVPDAIGYDCAAYARKFRTENDALNFIHTKMPEWGRTCHKPVAFSAPDFAWEALGLAAVLWLEEPIPEKMLAPTANRLRIWRR